MKHSKDRGSIPRTSTLFLLLFISSEDHPLENVKRSVIIGVCFYDEYAEERHEVIMITGHWWNRCGQNVARDSSEDFGCLNSVNG